MEIEKYAEKHVHFYREEINETLKKYLTDFSWSTLLDSGCGDGSLLYALQKNGFLEGKTVFALDLSEKRVARINKNIKGVSAKVDNAETMSSIPDNAIDFFISTQVIEHVDDRLMARSIERVAKPGSIVYIATIFKKRWGWYYYRKNGKWVIDPTHLREYTKDEQLLDLFSKDHFEVLENLKKLTRYPLLDFVFRRLGMGNSELYFKLFRYLKFLTIPVPGYYSWVVILKRK